MLPNEFQSPAEPESVSTGGRIGDLAAMLRVMTPLNGSLPDPAVGRRQLLADLCRFIGVKVGALPPAVLAAVPDTSTTPTSVNSTSTQPGPGVTTEPAVTELSPRQEQTLGYLLAGDSEKQVARKLNLSQHTVHVYVKALYRRFGVSSRAELLARHLKK
jgi:DNA-binding CsgD family transcriptional regulator